MNEVEITIVNRLGLHARAAAKFVHLASAYSSRVTVAIPSEIGTRWVERKETRGTSFGPRVTTFRSVTLADAGRKDRTTRRAS